MKKIIAEIIENKQVAPRYYRMRIESAYLGRKAKPGQFVEIRCSGENEPLLRRPLGVHRIAKGGIEILYEVVGKGTELLAQKLRGETLDVIGPLGNGFGVRSQKSEVRSQKSEVRSQILVAGGVGVAPLLSLAEELAFSFQLSAISKKIIVIIGAKTKSQILCEAEFKKLGCKVLVSTDDGSKGKRGLATDTLQDFLRYTIHDTRYTIYACGPTPMLKAVADIARTRHIPCQVSLEERMACGVGVCLGCPVKVRKTFTRYEIRDMRYEYKMVCKDGPVFDAKEIIW